MSHSSRVKILVFLALVLLLALPRLMGLERFVTVDEPAWLKYSANFYYALGQRDFEKTVYEYHPAVTSMWITTAAFLSYFPEYRGLGQGYIDKDWQFNALLEAHGKQPQELLWRSRLISVLIVTGALVFSYFLMRRLLGGEMALMATLLIAFDAYFMGHSRLLNHEALLSVFLLISMLGMLLYLEQGGRLRFLLISAVFGGLALLTKSSAILIFPLVLMMLAVRLVEEWRAGAGWRESWGYLNALLLWLAVLAGTYILLWPGMWLNPGKMLYEVYGNALSYAFQGSRLSITGGISPAQFDPGFGGLRTYLRSLAWGTSPLVWLGVLLAVSGLFARDKRWLPPLAKKVILYFSLAAILFVLMYGIARGRNSAHYILYSYICLDVIAGIGLVSAAGWLGGKVPFFGRAAVRWVVLLGMLVMQATGTLLQAPYYYTYANPITAMVDNTGSRANITYGEGLEQAAAYLAGKPGADKLTAISWYGIGPFSYFFPGKAHILKSSDTLISEEVEELRASDYLVIYYAQQARRSPTGKLILALQSIEPEASIWINGIEYARIYPVERLPETFFELVTQ